MSEVSVTNLLPLYTNEIVASYSDHRKPMSFGRSLYKEVVTASKLASVISQRGFNLVASDVPRGSFGDFNVFDKYTQNQIFTPYYNEPFSLSELDSYDYLRVVGVKSKIAFGAFLDEYAQKLEYCLNKIERRYELQSWQALETGIVTLVTGQNISFGRKAESFETMSGVDLWTNSAADPWDVIQRGLVFITETGKMKGGVANVILGRNAITAYLKNAKVVDRAKQVQWGLEHIVPVQRDSTGKIYHGEVSVGQWKVRLWSYAEFYENADGSVKTPFVNADKIIILPEVPENVITYTAVPGLISMGAPKAQKFHTYAKVDTFNETEVAGVKSAGVAQLVAVDQVFTAKVV